MPGIISGITVSKQRCIKSGLLCTGTIIDSNNKEIPPQFKSKEHNRTVTRISEYSNAMYNGGVFQNPQFLSC